MTTTNVGTSASWAELVAAAPELAERVRRRFVANLHHVLGTIRPTGAPRLSGTEVRIDDEHVRLGMMPGSRKLADVRRDPQVELHSAPLEEDLTDGDAKLAGRLRETPAWDPSIPVGTYFALDIELVSLVRVEGEELVLTTWRAGGEVVEHRRR
jgi:hypothetical protein